MRIFLFTKTDSTLWVQIYQDYRMTFDIFPLRWLNARKARDSPTTYGTHPSAAKRQTLCDDVNAKNLENLLRGQLFLGDILGVGQVERLVPWRNERSLFPTEGSWHLSPSAGRRKSRDRAMPQHCRAVLLLYHIQEPEVNVRCLLSWAVMVSSFRRRIDALLAEPPHLSTHVASLLSITL